MVFQKQLFNASLLTADGTPMRVSPDRTWAATAGADRIRALEKYGEECVAQRWDLPTATAALAELHARTGAGECARRHYGDTVAAITDAFVERRDAAPRRCLRRYC